MRDMRRNNRLNNNNKDAMQNKIIMYSIIGIGILTIILVALLIYSKSFTKGRHLNDRRSFADIGQTILKNFNLSSTKTLIGSPIEEILEE